MRRVLVTGGDGQLGRALSRHAWSEGWEISATTRTTLDLADPGAIARIVAEGAWAAVINAGAYTAVDRAEGDVVTAWQINALAPAALAAACASAGIPLVQVSTDYVFDGVQAGARQPDDPVGPANVYGASKLGGELAVRTAGGRHAIVRTAWVVSADGQNFVKTMLRVAADRPVVRVVADQFGSPTSATDLAAAVCAITERLVANPDAPSGTWHFSNAGGTSWAEFAEAVFAGSAARGGPVATVEGIGTVDYPTPARRPAHSMLDTQTFTNDFGITPRSWGDALSDILDELLGAAK